MKFKIFETFLKKDFSVREKSLILGIAICSLLALGQIGNSQNTSSGESSQGQLDTQIPKDFVLVPFAIENQESIEALVGSFAKVNIYQIDDSSKRKKLLLRGAKLLRAPQNPQQFAALVLESEAELFTNSDSKYFVVIQNKNTTRESLSPKKKANQTFTYNVGERK
jgi:hypothetical protein